MFSSSTNTRPHTEMIVSMTDQVFSVCPTVMPKYSLTSQNPASFTCEKNSEPEPMARANSATPGWSRLAASGATMPAAVMVAPDAGGDQGRLEAAPRRDDEQDAGDAGKGAAEGRRDLPTVHADAGAEGEHP